MLLESFSKIQNDADPDGDKPIKPTSERTPQPETTTTEPTTQPSSKKTPPPTSKPNKCLDVLLYVLLGVY